MPIFKDNHLHGANQTNVFADINYHQGYLYIHRSFLKNDVIEMNMDMTPYRIYPNAQISADSGRVAIARGPLVYCAEGVDQASDVFSLYADPHSAIDVMPYDANILHGIVQMELNGYRIQNTKSLYSLTRPERISCRIKLIPYYAWGNRGLNQMRVWLPESSES